MIGLRNAFVAVAAGLVSFALGTDTAGSGRVPAAFNNLTGLKPALVQITGSSKRSLLRRPDFKPQAPRSRLQAQRGLERPDVPVGTVPCGCCAAAQCPQS